MTTLAAYLAQQRHSHRWTPFGNGLESCDCGAVRPVVVIDEDDEQRPETD